jgi:hypothetical protein
VPGNCSGPAAAAENNTHNANAAKGMEAPFLTVHGRSLEVAGTLRVPATSRAVNGYHLLLKMFVDRPCTIISGPTMGCPLHTTQIDQFSLRGDFTVRRTPGKVEMLYCARAAG